MTAAIQMSEIFDFLSKHNAERRKESPVKPDVAGKELPVEADAAGMESSNSPKLVPAEEFETAEQS